jgi:hypothetical protein
MVPQSRGAGGFPGEKGFGVTWAPNWKIEFLQVSLRGGGQAVPEAFFLSRSHLRGAEDTAL